MSLPKVGVVDYEMGNLHSVRKALALQNVKVVVSSQPRQLRTCRLLVVPGVGSFGPAMRNLRRNGMADFIREWIADSRPYLGICLGLQLLFERSEEEPRVKGLGVLSGRVVRFRPGHFRKGDFKIPHMGWNNAFRVPARRNRLSDGLFRGINERDYFYFVHSFYAAPDDAEIVMTETPYGNRFCSSILKGNVFASQFHLEKSGSVGLGLLKNVIGAALGDGSDKSNSKSLGKFNKSGGIN